MADAQPTPQTILTRGEEFESLYANNVQYEASVWDLKFIFGQLDQRKEGNEAIEQHTAITVPWAQAKIMAYFLAVNVTIQQAEVGKLPIPDRLVPPRPDPSNPALDANGKNVAQYLAWIHDQFFGTDPYIPPGVDSAKL